MHRIWTCHLFSFPKVGPQWVRALDNSLLLSTGRTCSLLLTNRMQQQWWDVTLTVILYYGRLHFSRLQREILLLALRKQQPNCLWRGAMWQWLVDSLQDSWQPVQSCALRPITVRKWILPTSFKVLKVDSSLVELPVTMKPGQPLDCSHVGPWAKDLAKPCTDFWLMGSVR